jgi:hypothetical protein
MFPGELVLDVTQIAKCLKLSRGHIYNLSSAKKLPFKVDASVEGRVRVSEPPRLSWRPVGLSQAATMEV